MLPRLSEKPDHTPGQYYIWSIPAKSVSVHLNLATIRGLTACAGAGLGTLPRRGLEVGGLLLGRVANPNPEQYIVSIEKIEPFEIEHVRGPSYILSASDRDELLRLIRKHDKKPDKGLTVVGYYRSHTRPGLYLDEYDHDLMRRHFAHASSVALLLRPVHEGPAKAGFFIWEDGEIHRASTYREFPLDADLLNPHRSAERPDASAPMVSPLPEQNPRPACPVIPISPPVAEVVNQPTIPVLAAAHRAATEGIGQAAAPTKATGVNRPATNGSSPAIPLEIQASPSIGETIAQQFAAGDTKRYMIWTAAAVALLLASAALWRPLVSPSVRPHNRLALNAEPTQSGLRLTWDQRNPMLRDYSSATLSITDGETEKKIALDAEQLKSGAIIYWPTSQDVNFRLQVGDFSESLRALAPKLPPKPEPEVAAIPDQPSQLAVAEPAGAPEAPPKAASPQTRTRQLELRTAVLPRQDERPPARSHEFVSPPPAELAATPPKLDSPMLTGRSVTRPPAAAADVEQLRGSGFKRAVSSIFGKGRKEDAFVPARAVHQVAPRLPGNVKVAEDTRVSVKVELDETGRVKGTDLVSRNVDTRLANAAMDAARRWRFEPARQRDKKVESSVILHFQFNREHSGG